MAQHGKGDGTAQAFRRALGKFPTGVTVVTTRTTSGRLEGLTANSFSSVSLDPPLVLWSLRKAAPSFAGFRDAGCFAVNVLGAEQHGFSRHFATPSPDKFGGVGHRPGVRGCPVLLDSLAVFECVTHDIVDAGDHVIFLGMVERFDSRDGAPLVFSGGGYATAASIDRGPVHSAALSPNHARECCG